MTPREATLHKGATYMVVGAGLFLAYAIVFFFLSFSGEGFEIGVPTLNGVTPADLDALSPAVMAYITHLHLATAGFIAATAVAVMALCWFGVRRGDWRAWLAAMISPVIGLIVALPMHYIGAFEHNWVTHIGPIYLGTLIFVVGGLMALSGLMKSEGAADV
ncbi:MAG: hypothetical protein ACU0DI_09475 [Paracoccaceae bacterium]